MMHEPAAAVLGVAVGERQHWRITGQKAPAVQPPRPFAGAGSETQRQGMETSATVRIDVAARCGDIGGLRALTSLPPQGPGRKQQ